MAFTAYPAEGWVKLLKLMYYPCLVWSCCTQTAKSSRERISSGKRDLLLPNSPLELKKWIVNFIFSKREVTADRTELYKLWDNWIVLLYALHQNWLILSTLFCPIYSENSNRVPSILSLGSETPSLLRAMLHFYLHGKFLFEFIKVFIYEYRKDKT